MAALLPSPGMPRHTISPERDRMQSRLLVWVACPVFAYMLCLAIGYASTFRRSYSVEVLAISVIFALGAWRLRAATPSAAVFGGVVCLTLTLSTSGPETASSLRTGLTPLLLLFILTFAATRLGRQRKTAAGLAESRQGRNAAQVIANLGIAAIAAGFWLLHYSRFHSVGGDRLLYASITPAAVFKYSSLPALAALVEATADTVSSEIGQAFGGTPRMLLTLRPVPPGTDGAITLTGTLAGIAAGAMVAASGIPALGMDLGQCGVALAAGTAGLFFDSLVGATVERKGWIGNDLVNLSSTGFAAAFAVWLVRVIHL